MRRAVQGQRVKALADARNFSSALPPKPVQWKAREGLASLVQHAVQTMSFPGRHEPFPETGSQRFSAESLLGLLVYFYAQDVFGENEMASRLQKDPIAKKLAGTGQPEIELLRSFRQTHRREIRNGLEHLFETAGALRFGHAGPDDTPIDFCVAESLDSWLHPLCGAGSEIEAHVRLELARAVDQATGMAAFAHSNN
jgi:hypothetical protein